MFTFEPTSTARRFLVSSAIALGIAALAGLPTPVRATPGIAGFLGRTVEVNGTRIYYESAGSGTPVLLIHGYTQTGRAWRPLAVELARTHTVIVPDLRGLGQSAPATSGFDKKTAAADLHALMLQLGHARADVVGHDIGLMVAYAYAAQWPQAVRRLVVLDAPLPGVGPWDQVWRTPALWHFHFHGPTAEALVRGRERIYFDHFWNDFAADPKAVSTADRAAYTNAYAAPGRMQAGFGYFAAFAQDARDNQAMAREKLPMPVLAIGGEKSAGSLVASQFAEVAADVTSQVVAGSGHWLLEEKPDEVIPLIVEFLNAGGPK